MNKKRVLVVDDEIGVIRFLRASLEANDYKVLTAMDGDQALQTFELEPPDLIILDIMMPEINGFEVCRRIREWSHVPIIMLSACPDESDKVKSLDLGADDYVTKPFGADELMARVRAVMRRTETLASVPNQPCFISGDLQVNFVHRQVIANGKEVKMTPTEFNLMREFVLNAGKVLTHTHLLKKIWGLEYQEEREYLHVLVYRLRTKLEPHPTKPRHIISVPGVGYQFRHTR